MLQAMWLSKADRHQLLLLLLLSLLLLFSPLLVVAKLQAVRLKTYAQVNLELDALAKKKNTENRLVCRCATLNLTLGSEPLNGPSARPSASYNLSSVAVQAGRSDARLLIRRELQNQLINQIFTQAVNTVQGYSVTRSELFSVSFFPGLHVFSPAILPYF